MADPLLLYIVVGNVFLILGGGLFLLSRSNVRQMIGQLLKEITYSRESHEKKWQQQLKQSQEQLQALKTALAKSEASQGNATAAADTSGSNDQHKEAKHFRGLYQSTQNKLEKAEKKLNDLLRYSANTETDRKAHTPADEIFKLKCDKADLQTKLSQLSMVLESTVSEDNQAQRLTLLEQQATELQRLIGQQEEEIHLLETQNLLLQQQSPDAKLSQLLEQFVDDAQQMMAYILDLEQSQQELQDNLARLEPLAMSRTADEASKNIAELQLKLASNESLVVSLQQQLQVLQQNHTP